MSLLRVSLALVFAGACSSMGLPPTSRGSATDGGGSTTPVGNLGALAFANGPKSVKAFALDLLRRNGHDPGCYDIGAIHREARTFGPGSEDVYFDDAVDLTPSNCASEFPMKIYRRSPGALQWILLPGRLSVEQKQVLQAARAAVVGRGLVKKGEAYRVPLVVIEAESVYFIETYPDRLDEQWDPVPREWSMPIVVVLKRDTHEVVKVEAQGYNRAWTESNCSEPPKP